MAEVDTLILENVRLFLRLLINDGIHVSKAYIFGSYDTGKPDQWSNIDVAFVSPQIGADRFEERVKLTKIAIRIDDRIEPMPFNHKSFKENDPLVQEIIANGILVTG